jgi:ribonuclease HI
VLAQSPVHGNMCKELGGAEPDTPNNRMALTAALRALKAACRVELFTNAQYVRHAFEARWREKWQRMGRRTSNKQPVQNADLGQVLLERTREHQVRWTRGAGALRARGERVSGRVGGGGTTGIGCEAGALKALSSGGGQAGTRC